MATTRKRGATRTPKTATKRGKQRTVWHFGPSGTQGDAGMKQLLGGKGANLAEMCRVGLPVPAGFTIATNVCDRFNKSGGKQEPA